MSSTKLFRKHFGERAAVDLKHPNMEAFFNDLNKECLQEDTGKLKITIMKYSFYAELKLHIELADNIFNMLLETCKNHYDGTVQRTVMVGGFLYGAKNRRDWSKGEDKELELTFRQADAILKALEMNNSDNAESLSKTIYNALEEMYAKQKEINAGLNK